MLQAPTILKSSWTFLGAFHHHRECLTAPADTVVSKDAVVSTISYLYYLQSWHLWAQPEPPPNSLISHYRSPTLCLGFIIYQYYIYSKVTKKPLYGNDTRSWRKLWVWLRISKESNSSVDVHHLWAIKLLQNLCLYNLEAMSKTAVFSFADHLFWGVALNTWTIC